MQEEKYEALSCHRAAVARLTAQIGELEASGAAAQGALTDAQEAAAQLRRERDELIGEQGQRSVASAFKILTIMAQYSCQACQNSNSSDACCQLVTR